MQILAACGKTTAMSITLRVRFSLHIAWDFAYVLNTSWILVIFSRYKEFKRAYS